ncbi:MAG: ERF family protein [Paludibacter sp.]|nr:ERF family protein [Paludibacter sp.]
MAKATMEFKPIGKNSTAKVNTKTGGQYSYSYATLDEIINATKEALAKNGLIISHKTELIDGKMWLVSKLRHESGCRADKTKSQIDKYVGDGYMSPVQSYGSIITYLKRYHVGMLLNIAIDEDDDGADDKGKADKPKTQQKPKEENKPAETKSDSPNNDPSLAYIARINEMDNIFELNNWVDKHTPDLKKLTKEDQEVIRKLLAKRRSELQAKQDKINAEKANRDESEIPDEPEEMELDGLGDGEKEHNMPA